MAQKDQAGTKEALPLSERQKSSAPRHFHTKKRPGISPDRWLKIFG
jgi:hypothetical protein